MFLKFKNLIKNLIGNRTTTLAEIPKTEKVLNNLFKILPTEFQKTPTLDEVLSKAFEIERLQNLNSFKRKFEQSSCDQILENFKQLAGNKTIIKTDD